MHSAWNGEERCVNTPVYAVDFGTGFGVDGQVGIQLLLDLSVARREEEASACDVKDAADPVSYTHLTLPTICSV
eukprot:424119-Rhodomonas_salina.3